LNQLVIENISQGVIVTGPDRLILSVNAAFGAITGYSRQESLGRDCKFLVGPLTDRATTEAIRSALRTNSPFAGEIQNHRKDGTPFWNELTITPVFDAQGSLSYFIGVIRDFTGRKRIEEEKVEVEAQLRQSQKLEGIGQLSGGIAHDFNNLLTAILGYTTLLQDEPLISPMQQEMLEQISNAGNRAASLTRQLLLFSRRETPVRHDVDLNHVVAELFKMLRRLLGENIDIHLALTAQPQFVHADSGMLDQVLLNLAVNARDAMPRGGKLTIATQPVTFTADPAGGALRDSREFEPRAPVPGPADALAETRPPTSFAFRREGNFTCLNVTDEGCGIPPEVIGRIFEPFYTTKEEGKGTGLGLATVYGAVQMHEGWIEVKSQPGQGSTFQVYLPRIQGSSVEEVSAPRAPLEKSGHGETILVVEDETIVRLATRLALERSGYRVVDCKSGAAALELWPAHRDRIDLVITDMVMPGGVSGLDLIKQLTAIRPELLCILMSGYSSTLAEDIKALPPGVKFLSKPFPLPGLLGTVRATLDAKPRSESRTTL
jgi:PAS domain S-box-containing protein